MKDFFLSVVIPAYNEKGKLAGTLKEISEFIRKSGIKAEVIIVDDGSTDGTPEEAAASASMFEKFSILVNDKNMGKGFSVKKGIFASHGDYILFMDADNSTSIKEIEKFIPLLDSGAAGYIASRRVEGSRVTMPFLRDILGKFFIIISKTLLGIGANDINCGFKVFRSSAARDIFALQTMNDWSFDAETLFIAKKLGYGIKEVPVEWVYKPGSKVKPLKDGINSLCSMVKIKMNDINKVYARK